MESTNISVKKEKPYKINLTVGMSFLALFCCLLGIFLIYSNLTPAQEDGSNEYIVSSVYYILIALIFAVLMVIGGLRKYANTSKLAAIYLLLALIFIYQVTRIIAVSTSLVPKIYKILYDEVNYSTDLSRSNAIQSLQRETSMVIGNGIVALVGIAVTCFFATKKTLDGESRWPYLVVFFLTLFFLYMSAYYEANILNSVSNMNAEFIAIFNESRTCAIAYISLFVISYNNDYDPDLDPTLLNASVAAQ